ncbi:MAG: hypothetical protein H8K03_06710 [Nitrospira sp.]|jgi:hypothetical protein|nr:hypothetical protein [Nitrospira sp. BO4]
MLPLSLALILAAAMTSPAAAEEQSACSLLTSGDVESVIGGQLRATQPLKFDDVPAGPNRVIKTLGCLLSVPTHTGQVSIGWYVGPITDQEIDQLLKMSKDNVGVNNLKKANYKEVSKDFPHASCSTLSPPASAKDGMYLSTCAGGVKGHGLSIQFMSPTKALTIDQAKALLDKAAAHVP